VVARYAPGRGEVIWLQFDPQAGHEQAGRRPAVVVSPREYNAKTGLALCCPITSRIKGYPFEVALSEGSEVSGVILADQVKSLDWRARRARKLWTLPEDCLQELLAKIRVLIE
jgi:mRNA interferase MazF